MIEEKAMERVDRSELYPQLDEVGETDVWCLPQSVGYAEVKARFLGVSTSRQAVHSHPGDYVTDTRKCHRCRWFEPRLFRETSGVRRYLIYTIGCSDVPGEIDLIRLRWARDGYEAVSLLKTPHPVTGVRSIVGVTQRVLEQAAVYEKDLVDALMSEGISPGTGAVRH
jgi:hypothetical protein